MLGAASSLGPKKRLNRFGADGEWAPPIAELVRELREGEVGHHLRRRERLERGVDGGVVEDVSHGPLGHVLDCKDVHLIHVAHE